MSIYICKEVFRGKHFVDERNCCSMCMCVRVAFVRNWLNSLMMLWPCVVECTPPTDHNKLCIPTSSVHDQKKPTHTYTGRETQIHF